MHFDATHDADTVCMQCGIQLTKSNQYSSWLCIDCHEAETEARGEHRPALLEAMRRYNQPTVRSLAKTAAAGLALLTFAGLIHFLNSKHDERKGLAWKQQ